MAENLEAKASSGGRYVRTGLGAFFGYYAPQVIMGTYGALATFGPIGLAAAAVVGAAIGYNSK